MAPPPKRNPLPIDKRKSSLWAISSLASVGVGYSTVGTSLAVFDLVNRETGRAHRLTLRGGGGGAGLPFSASFDSSPYGHFRTARPVNFHDFNGIWMEVGEVNIVIYSWNDVVLRDGATSTKPVLGRTKMKGWGKGIPGAGTQHGTTEVLFTDGRPVDPVQLELVPDLTVEVQLPPHHKIGSMTGYKVPGDTLFDFDKHNIKPTATWALDQAADYIKENKRSADKVYVTGHTDNIGNPAYNKALSERRARTVAKWLIDNKHVTAKDVVPLGLGASKPVELNQLPGGKDHPYGREKNRRVEILIL